MGSLTRLLRRLIRAGRGNHDALPAGFAWEEEAARFLQKRGCRILERNFRARRGELDIVALDRGETVFVEVRARASDDFGGAAASITPAKQARIVAAAKEFLQRRHMTDSPCRFDVILVSTACVPPQIEHIEDAFGERIR